MGRRVLPTMNHPDDETDAEIDERQERQREQAEYEYDQLDHEAERQWREGR